MDIQEAKTKAKASNNYKVVSQWAQPLPNSLPTPQSSTNNTTIHLLAIHHPVYPQHPHLTSTTA